MRLFTSPSPASLRVPANAVTRAQLDVLGPVDLAAAPATADFFRLPGDSPAVLAFKHDLAGLVVHARDPALVALVDADPFVGAMEGHHIAYAA